MPARILDGAAVAQSIREELKPRIEAFRQRAGRAPGLGIVLAGEHPASEIYVRNKLRAAADVGIAVELVRLPSSATLGELLTEIARLNESGAHDGILVQSPLPPAMGEEAGRRVFEAIAPAKDVDGLNPVNVGRLVQQRATLSPCTPSGVMALLERAGISIAGTHAVVLGRSEIVGKPMALLLLHRHATVTVCHSRTVNLPSLTAQADILVAAIGRPAYVTAEMVRPGATVIDVGINRLNDSPDTRALLRTAPAKIEELTRRGFVLVGDVHPEVAATAGALTPVPGGVGPLTIAMLMTNTVRAAEGIADCRFQISD